MLFSDINSLQEIISTTIRTNEQYHDDNDPEIDRFLNSSPPINESILQASYEYETMKTYASRQNALNTTRDCEKSYVYEDSAPVAPQKANDNNNTLRNSQIIANNIPITKTPSLIFTSAKIPNKSDLKNLKSQLTLNLQKSSSGSTTGSIHNASTMGGKLKLTIYLPDYSSISITCTDSDNFDMVLKKALMFHKDEKKTPKLCYNHPEYYELRMHEGEGEPDRDFPALDPKKLLKSFNEKEYCLCQKDGVKFNPLSTSSEEDIGRKLSSASSAILPYESDILTIIIPGISEIIKIPFEPTLKLNDYNARNSGAYGVMNEGVAGGIISSPDSENDETDCMVRDRLFRDILPDIKSALESRNKDYKLRLCTDEFVFVVPVDEQAKFKLLQPYVTLNTPIMSLPVRKFELQKRVFADSLRTQRISAVNRPHRRQTNNQNTVYSDTLANVYQEWNVKKRSKYGSLQERIIGIDGKMVYTMKRDAKRTGTINTARAQRSLDTIRSVEVINNPLDSTTSTSAAANESNREKRTLRIVFEEETQQHEVEYICDSVKDCNEILEKLKFLLAKRQKKI